MLWVQAGFVSDYPAVQYTSLGFSKTSTLLVLFLPLLRKSKQFASWSEVAAGLISCSSAVCLSGCTCTLFWRGMFSEMEHVVSVQPSLLPGGGGGGGEGHGHL